MYKIAILGCENSHAKNFLDLIAAGAYPEIEVVGVYSNEPEAAQKLRSALEYLFAQSPIATERNIL